MKTFLVILFLFPCFAFATQTDTMKVKYKNNVLELKQQRPDTITVINPQTYQKEKRVISHPAIPLTLNGTPIFYTTHTNFIINAAVSKLHECLTAVFKDIKDSLPAGTYAYSLPDLVIGADGKIAYHSSNGFNAFPAMLSNDLQSGKLTAQQYESYNRQFENALDELQFTPLIIDGEAVPFRKDIVVDIRLAQ